MAKKKVQEPVVDHNNPTVRKSAFDAIEELDAEILKLKKLVERGDRATILKLHERKVKVS